MRTLALLLSLLFLVVALERKASSFFDDFDEEDWADYEALKDYLGDDMRIDESKLDPVGYPEWEMYHAAHG